MLQSYIELNMFYVGILMRTEDCEYGLSYIHMDMVVLPNVYIHP
jgi:hypothetical protein